MEERDDVKRISSKNIDVVFVNPYIASEDPINSSVVLGSEMESYDLVLIFQYSTIDSYDGISIGGLLREEFPEIKEGKINLTNKENLYSGTLTLFRKMSLFSEKTYLPSWVCLPIVEVPKRPGVAFLNLEKIISGTLREDLLGSARKYSNDEAISKIYEAAKKAMYDLSRTSFSNYGCPVAEAENENRYDYEDLGFKISPSGVDFLIPGRHYEEGILIDYDTGEPIDSEAIDEYIDNMYKKNLEKIKDLNSVSVNALPIALELEIEAGGRKRTRKQTLASNRIGVTIEPRDGERQTGKSKTSVVVVPHVKEYREDIVGLDVILVHAISGIEDFVSRIDLDIREEDAGLEEVEGWGGGKIWDFVKRKLPDWAKRYKEKSDGGDIGVSCKTRRGNIPISLTRGTVHKDKTGYSFGVHRARAEREKNNTKVSVSGFPFSLVKANHEGIKVIRGTDILNRKVRNSITPGEDEWEGNIVVPKEFIPTYALKVLDEEKYYFPYTLIPLSGLVLSVSKEIVKDQYPWCIGDRLLLGSRPRAEDTKTERHIREGLARIAMAIYVMSEYLERPDRDCGILINMENKERENHAYGDFLSRLFEYLLSKEHGYISKTLGEKVSVFTSRGIYIKERYTDDGETHEVLGGGCYLDLYMPIGEVGEWEISIATRYPMPIEAR